MVIKQNFNITAKISLESASGNSKKNQASVIGETSNSTHS